MRLTGRVAVVTGAASGIGRACAHRLASEGAAVAVLDRAGDDAARTAAEITGAGGRSLVLEADVADDGAVAAAIDLATGLGRITDVVTAAGIFHPADLRPAHEVNLDDFVHVLSVNLVGTFSTIRHALPSLVDGGGSIVTIASTAALRGHGHGAGYSASKGGVDALTRLLAVQYGPHGVRANCVCPGGVDTPMTGGVLATDEARAGARRRIPLGTYARPEQIAAVVAFCCSADADYLTGQTVPVEGGATVA